MLPDYVRRTDAVIFRIEGDSLQCVANYGPMPVVGECNGLSFVEPPRAEPLLNGKRFTSMTSRQKSKPNSRNTKHIQERTGTAPY